jgi:hypothetical protein
VRTHAHLSPMTPVCAFCCLSILNLFLLAKQ